MVDTPGGRGPAGVGGSKEGSTAVGDAIAEIDKQLADLAPKYEGLQDYGRLNLQPETLEAVNGAIHQYDEYIAALQAAKEALVALQEYPPLEIPDASRSVMADLEANKKTIEIALAQFAASPPPEIPGTEPPTGGGPDVPDQGLPGGASAKRR